MKIVLSTISASGRMRRKTSVCVFQNVRRSMLGAIIMLSRIKIEFSECVLK